MHPGKALSSLAIKRVSCNEAHLHVADALKGVVTAPLGELHQNLLNGLLIVLGVQAISGTKLLGSIKLGRVDIDGKDAGSTCLLGSLNHSQANSTQAEDSNGGAGLDLGGVVHSTPASGHTTAQQSHLQVEGNKVQ